MNNNNPKIFISAGEASGDMLGANLAKALFARIPNCQITGMGGQQMQAAGVNIFLKSDKAVVGAIEILKHLKDLIQNKNAIKDYLREQQPNLLILIDFPGFNLVLAKAAHELGIKILYYVSPQIWAWHASRIEKIKSYITHMAVLFPFEVDIYQKAGVPVTLVGHPLLDIAKPNLPKHTILQMLKLNSNHPIIGLFPGSRIQEIEKLLPVIIRSVKRIKAAKPNAQFILPIALSIDPMIIKSKLPDYVRILTGDNNYNALQICDTAIAVSGTVTLEIALFKIPLTIIYKVSLITYIISICVLKLDLIGLCNIIANKMIAKEFIQYRATAKNISNEILHILNNKNYANSIRQEMQCIRKQLGSGNAAQKVAELANQLIMTSTRDTALGLVHEVEN